MKIGILTSTDTRHRFVARMLCEQFYIAAVGHEEIDYWPADAQQDDTTPTEREVVQAHFAERSRQETLFFANKSQPLENTPNRSVRQIKPGRLNTLETLSFLTDAGVDTVVVYGTNLIKSPLIHQWPGQMINLHLGLSPYYRGTATNFYPLLNEEPEYVGATIHFIDPGIDSGPILKHARPDITEDDAPHSIGCKAIIAGVRAMAEVLERLESNRLEGVAQWSVPNPRLYLRQHYHPRQVVELYEKLADGLIPKYVARAHQVAPRVRLIN